MSSNSLKKESIVKRIFSNNAYCWLSLLCTAMLMVLVYFCFDLFPFGDVTILRMDLYHQYGPLFAEFYDRVMNAKSFIYSWNTGLGSPFMGNFCNYLSSPSAIFMLLFGHENMPEAIAMMILTKAACAAGTFTYYLKKSQHRHDFTTAAFGVLYAMCGYFVAYYWNVMWIDAMVYFPLVMYGIERIINKRKPALYIASLALTLFSNYYMGYMTCIFSVVYFIVYYFSNYEISSLADNTVYTFDYNGKKKYRLIEKIKGSVFLRSGLTFAFSSLAAGCLVAVTLIPTVIILRSCSATSGTWPTDYRIYFSIFDFLANHLASVDPTIRSSGDDVLPNVYCGMVTLILVPLYIFSKKISLKEKIASVFTLGLIYCSFNLNYLNYIWHGFHFPNDLPYRFSYMYCFLLLVMAYKAFTHLSEYTGRQILGSAVAVVAAIILVQEIGSKNVEDITILLSVVFVVTYSLILYLLKDEKRQKSAIAVILLCSVIAEIACSDTDRFSMSQTKTNYTSDYKYFAALKDDLDEREDNEFYRMELTYNRARMDPAWYGYNGVSTFSSMAYEKMSNMQSDLGLYSNYINSYTYYLQTPVYNMMHSLKYIVDNDTQVTVEDDYYTEVESIDKFTAYENNYYLPIGMTVDSGITDWYSQYTNPFLTQGEWFELATGVSGVFTMMDVDSVSCCNVDEITSGFETGDVYFTRNSTDQGEITVVLSTEEAHHCYLFVDSDNFEELLITKNSDSCYQSIDEPYIYDLGIVSPDDYVEVVITVPEDNSSYGYMNFYPYYVNDDKLNEGYEILKENSFNVTSFEETDIKGTISADEDCVFFTSIPYDEGWTVKVDGKEIDDEDYINLNEAYLCFNLEKGDHDIEISFHQRGLKYGAMISGATMMILLIVAFIVKKKRPEWDRAYQRKCDKAQYDYEAMLQMIEEARAAENAPEEIPIEDMSYVGETEVAESAESYEETDSNLVNPEEIMENAAMQEDTQVAVVEQSEESEEPENTTEEQ